jgi:hypothetical protein
MPLRPDLYDRLIQVFGAVKILHEDEEMVCSVVRDFLYGGEMRMDVTDRGETYAVSCPFCSDTRFRLWINHRWGLYVPGVGMNLWLCKCFNDDCLAVHSKRVRLHTMVMVETQFSYGPRRDALRRGRRPARRRSEIEWPGPMLPVERMLHDWPARLYLEKRGFDLLHLSRALNVCYALDVKPRFAAVGGRIVIPIYMGGKPAGWQARYAGDLPDWKSTPKYYSCPGMKKTEVLYNYDGARKWPFAVVCEGATDVWRVGPQAVALLGKTASPAQKALIAAAWGRGAAVVLLDGDAARESEGLTADLRALVRQVVEVRLPGGLDPGGCGHRELWSLIFRSAAEQGVDLGALLPARTA